MDGFDDLLNQSRQALEDNPFANPFAKRSSSPDPWATPFSSNESENAFGSGAEHFGSSETHYGASSSSDHFATSESAEETPEATDPLDSAAETAETDDDDDNKPLANFRSPGFRESVVPAPAAPFSETATIRPTHIEEFSQEGPTVSAAGPESDNNITTDTGAAHSSESNNIPSLAPIHTTQQPTPWTTSSISGSTSAVETGFKSPLETSFGGLEHSLAGLSLGAEPIGGWHTEEQTPWQPEPVLSPATSKPAAPVDDDSDDDKPILQAYQKQRESASVSDLYFSPKKI